ncbi:MAG TPA: hypothetical protein VKH35_14975 [Thermoanaerobaculia bacterium]|nr:hypothetical protein [Thermoanaerobaculia bacterium]
MRRIRLAALILALCSVVSAAEPPASRRILVIVSASRPITDISTVDLRRIFLAQRTRWPDGHSIVPVLPPTRSPEGEFFLRHVVQTDEIDYAHTWIGAVFRGATASVPIVAATSDQAKRFVAEERDAMAIIRDTPIGSDAIRALSVDGKRPSDPKYPLSW